MRSCSTSPARRARRAGGAPSADWERPRDPTSGPRRRGPFTFIAPRRLSDEPLTRARVRLLGPCFKTGRVGSRHRRRPRALGSAPLRTERRDRRTPPARRRDDARGALRTVRPDPGTPEEGGRWESGRAVGGAARPPPPTPPEGGGEGERRARRRVSGSLGPGIRRALLPGGCNTRGGVVRRPRVDAAPPEPPSPPGLPSRPGAGRGAPPTVEVRPAAAGSRPRGGPPPTPPPAPPARRPRPREGRGERTRGWRGREERGAGKIRPGAARPDERRRVESSGRTARTPPVYLLTVSRPLELSLQSSFQLSLTVLVDYRSRAGI